MNSSHIHQIADVLQQMRQIPALSAGRRRSLDRLGGMAWADDVAALSRLWSASPQLVEQYVDVMVSALHALPGTIAKEPAEPLAPYVDQ